MYIGLVLYGINGGLGEGALNLALVRRALVRVVHRRR